MTTVEELTGVSLFPKHIDQISLNGDTGQLAVSASNLTGRTWNGVIAVFNDAKFAPNIPHLDYACVNEAGVTDIEWIDETRIVIGTDAGSVEVWQLKDAPMLENTMLLHEHDDICSAISISKHSKQIISASWDNCIKLWDLEVDLSIHSIRIHTDRVFDVLWNHYKSDVFATASEDGTVKMYDNRDTGKPCSVLHSSDRFHPTCLDWLNETSICAGYCDGMTRLLDTRNSNGPLAEIRTHKKAINDILCFNDYVATCSDDMKVSLYHLKDNLQTYSDDRHTDYVTGLTLNGKDRSLWSCAWDGTVLQHSYVN